MCESGTFFLCPPGVECEPRKVACLIKPSVSISFNGERMDIQAGSACRNTEISFKLGEEFEETTADNRKVKVSWS
jgi:hypothetical protein